MNEIYLERLKSNEKKKHYKIGELKKILTDTKTSIL